MAFLFPGQGAQHVGMGADLYRDRAGVPPPRRRLRRAAAPHLGVDLRELLLPPAGGEDAAAERLRADPADPAGAVHRRVRAGPALGGVGRAPGGDGRPQHRRVRGGLPGRCVRPADALAAVAVRGRLMQTMPAGAMLAVPLPADEIEPRLPDGVTLAAVNAPRLSAWSPAPDRRSTRYAARWPPTASGQPLHTSHAFHSPDDGAGAGRVRRPPGGRWALTAPRIADSLQRDRRLDHRRPGDRPGLLGGAASPTGRFDAGARRLVAAGHVLLEVGPGTTLATLVRQQDGVDGRRVVSSLSHPGRPVPDGAALADALGRLWLAGVPVDWPGRGRTTGAGGARCRRTRSSGSGTGRTADPGGQPPRPRERTKGGRRCPRTRPTIRPYRRRRTRAVRRPPTRPWRTHPPDLDRPARRRGHR